MGEENNGITGFKRKFKNEAQQSAYNYFIIISRVDDGVEHDTQDDQRVITQKKREREREKVPYLVCVGRENGTYNNNNNNANVVSFFSKPRCYL